MSCMNISSKVLAKTVKVSNCCMACLLKANRRYPNQLQLPSNYECVFEEDGGILFASRCLAAFQVRPHEGIIIMLCIYSFHDKKCLKIPW